MATRLGSRWTAGQARFYRRASGLAGWSLCISAQRLRAAVAMSEALRRGNGARLADRTLDGDTDLI